MEEWRRFRNLIPNNSTVTGNVNANNLYHQPRYEILHNSENRTTSQYMNSSSSNNYSNSVYGNLGAPPIGKKKFVKVCLHSSLLVKKSFHLTRIFRPLSNSFYDKFRCFKIQFSENFAFLTFDLQQIPPF